ncbi:Flp pilus assembly complex ATPase component TadA, partial [Patescibacteria group bacterium]|nr:Flp pilus assembly complex ATPase component TadA [Patescibacteria group bacterium]
MLFTNEQLKSIFVDGGFLTAEEFEKARKTAALRQVPVTDSIVEFGYLSDSEVGALLAAEKGLFFVDLSREKVNQNILLLIPEKVALAKRVVAYKKDKEKVWVAMANPDDYEFIKLLEKKIGPPLKIVYATPFGIEGVLKGYQKDLLLQATELIERMSKKPQEQDIVKLVDLLIRSAHENRASDIHIEPEEEYVIVRFRIDGVMHEMLRYPITNHDKVVFRIKILGRMRTDEHAQAQDGRFEFKSEEGRFNLRVSIIPITRGENVVMRILSEKFQRLRLEDLGFLEHDLAKIKKVSKLPHGMIIASGPTGSGKTTSLYAVINVLNKPDVNITTIEDPVEYDI